ncbi:hypothetical protein AVEN_100075-1 [Araneus ventricosus]|uniref:Uncharacterized protein n=1 Tax=Araneus ventricosus TaxID=182803 RepID=A0A4Y2MXY7_ARAVE|nr:hypothetical protein AVEN_100075-1 [Araneus ventricosus]
MIPCDDMACRGDYKRTVLGSQSNSMCIDRLGSHLKCERLWNLSLEFYPLCELQHEGYFGTDLVILNHGQRTTPELELSSPNFHATPAGGRLATAYDLACNRPHTRRIFSGIGFRTWSPRDPTIRPPRTPVRGMEKWSK